MYVVNCTLKIYIIYDILNTIYDTRSVRHKMYAIKCTPYKGVSPII